MVYGINGCWVKHGNAGDIIEINPRDWHEICAMEDNTVIFNGWKNGIPKGYSELPDSEKYTSYDKPLSHTINDKGVPIMLPEYEGVYEPIQYWLPK